MIKKYHNRNILMNLIPYLMVVFIFEPKLFVKYQILNIIYIIGIVAVFLLVILYYIMKNISLPKMFWILVFYRCSFLLQTILISGDLAMWGYFSIVLIAMCLSISLYAKINIHLILNAIINVLTVILFLNLITVFIFPNGIIDELYLIGIRTRFTDLIIPLIVLTLVSDRLKQKRISIKTIVIIAISVFTIFKLWIATAILGIVVFFVFVFLFGLFKLKSKKSLFIILFVGLLLNYLVVFCDILKYFEWLITDILNKSISLSGRTDLWVLAIDIIRENIVFGHGMLDNGNFVWWSYGGSPYQYWQAHNQWLQLMFDGGLLTTISFITLILSANKGLNRHPSEISRIFLAGFATFFIMMITEIYSYTPYFYLLIFFGDTISNVNNVKQNKKVV